MKAKTATKTPPGRSLHRLFRSWELASARYNRDCNMRRAELGDAKRNKLKADAERAFQRMIEPIKRMMSPNDQAEARRERDP